MKETEVEKQAKLKLFEIERQMKSKRQREREKKSWIWKAEKVNRTWGQISRSHKWLGAKTQIKIRGSNSKSKSHKAAAT